MYVRRNHTNGKRRRERFRKKSLIRTKFVKARDQENPICRHTAFYIHKFCFSRSFHPILPQGETFVVSGPFAHFKRFQLGQLPNL